MRENDILLACNGSIRSRLMRLVEILILFRARGQPTQFKSVNLILNFYWMSPTLWPKIFVTLVCFFSWPGDCCCLNLSTNQVFSHLLQFLEGIKRWERFPQHTVWKCDFFFPFWHFRLHNISLFYALWNDSSYRYGEKLMPMNNICFSWTNFYRSTCKLFMLWT